MPSARRLSIDLLIILCGITWAVTIWSYMDRLRVLLLGAAIAVTVAAVQFAIAGWLNDRNNRRHGRTMAQLAAARQDGTERHTEMISASADVAALLQQISARMGDIQSHLPRALGTAKWTGYAEATEDLGGRVSAVVPLHRPGRN